MESGKPNIQSTYATNQRIWAIRQKVPRPTLRALARVNSLTHATRRATGWPRRIHPAYARTYRRTTGGGRIAVVDRQTGQRSAIRLAVAGARGRIGRCVLELASRTDHIEIAAALTKPEDPQCGTVLHAGNHEAVLAAELDRPCDVLIDFTVGDGTAAWLGVRSSPHAQ